MGVVEVKCKVCDVGSLTLKKVYRMNPPVVAIGYILLAPTIMAMIACIGVCFGRSSTSIEEARLTAFEKCRQDLLEFEVPPEIVDKVFPTDSGDVAHLDDEDYEILTEVEIDRIMECVDAYTKAVMKGFDDRLGEGVQGVALAVIFFGAFISGLVGWLLIQKKKILQCDACGAVVPAS